MATRKEKWKNAKELFTNLVLKEMPGILGRQRFVAAYVDPIDNEVVRALEELDNADRPFLDACAKVAPGKTEELKKAQGMIDAFKKNVTTFNDKVTTMATKLKEEAAKQKESDLPAAKKEAIVRGIKVLKTELESLNATNQASVQTMEMKLKGTQQTLNGYEVMSAQFLSTLKATVARGLAAVQRLKASPTPATWNAEFPKAARDITQQIVNAAKLKNNGFPPPGPADTKPLQDALVKFGDGEYKSIPTNTTTVEVNALIDKYKEGVKKVAEAYKGLL